MRNCFVFIVMCACIFFTAQCGRETALPEALPEVPPKISEETEELPEMDTLHYLVWHARYAKELSERVKCPSPVKTGEEEEPVGEWKLMLRINGTDTVDCSCENVVYRFKPDQTLTVSIGDETANDVAYEYWGYPMCPLCLPINPRPNLRMGSSEVYCWALPEIMYVYPQLEPENEFGIFPVRGIKWIFLRID
jgi:hypothetical protein